jgi:hypothetical protein
MILILYRYFDHLSPKTSMERTNLFIQTTPDLFQDAPECELLPSLIQASISPVKVETLQVRRERQTFTKLAHTGAVVFTVRSFMVPLTTLSVQELRALRSQVAGWEEEMKEYKGWEIWGAVLMGWCDARIAEDDLQGGCVDEASKVETEMEEKEEVSIRREMGCLY